MFWSIPGLIQVCVTVAENAEEAILRPSSGKAEMYKLSADNPGGTSGTGGKYLRSCFETRRFPAGFKTAS
jgi:hypothetical protein